MMTLREAAQAIEGEASAPELTFSAVTTDSRKVNAGELFVALRGERFDGHAFIAAAAQAGACGSLVERTWSAFEPAPALLRVADTRLALGALAHAWRLRFSLPVVALTGSNGKTTVKEMLAAILRTACGAEETDCVLATQGNLNNDIGLPLTLLRLRAQHRYAVVEMGMNHRGEIAYLTRIARPNVALINNAQRAHLGCSTRLQQ